MTGKAAPKAPKPNVTTYVTYYFNSNANPYGDFDPPSHDTKPLREITDTPEKLHEIMRADDTICAYETYDIHKITIDGVEMKSEPVNTSIRTIFGKVKKYKDMQVMDQFGADGNHTWIPMLQKYPHLDPEDVHVSPDGGGAGVNLELVEFRVIDRATDKQVWPEPKL